MEFLDTVKSGDAAAVSRSGLSALGFALDNGCAEAAAALRKAGAK